MIRETCEKLSVQEIKKVLEMRSIPFKKSDNKKRLLELYDMSLQDFPIGQIAWDFFSSVLELPELHLNNDKIFPNMKEKDTITVFRLNKKDWDKVVTNIPIDSHISNQLEIDFDSLYQSFHRGRDFGNIYELSPCQGEFQESYHKLSISKNIVKITFTKKIGQMDELEEKNIEKEWRNRECIVLDIIKKWKNEKMVCVKPVILDFTCRKWCEPRFKKLREKYDKPKKVGKIYTSHDFKFLEFSRCGGYNYYNYYHCIYDSRGNFVEFILTEENYPDPGFVSGDDTYSWFEKKSIWEPFTKSDLDILLEIICDDRLVSRVSLKSNCDSEKLFPTWITKDKEYYAITKELYYQKPDKKFRQSLLEE